MDTVQIEWIKQLGTAGEEDAYGITVDLDGNIYLTGYTSGTMEGENAGGSDAWVAKYNPQGEQLWLKQLGTAGEDESNGVAFDPQGNLYVLGYTYGVETSNATTGVQTWLAKYDLQGNQLWFKNLSDTRPHIPHSIAVDDEGKVYITGYSAPEHEDWEAWLAKYDGNGDRLWWTPLGKYHDRTMTFVTVGQDPKARTKMGRTVVYVSGNTTMPMLGEETEDQMWIARYNGEGIQRWIKPLGNFEETGCSGMTVDTEGNFYLAGYTNGTVAEDNAGGTDVWLAKYNTQGEQQWIHQLGSTQDEEATGITTDHVGNVYIAGFTYGAMTAEASAGDCDGWVAQYNSQGEKQWVKQLGTSAEDGCNGVAVDQQGNIYITGYTEGSMEGDNAGGYDAWLAKLKG